MLTQDKVVRSPGASLDSSPEAGPPTEASVLQLLNSLRRDFVAWIALEGDLARAELAEIAAKALRAVIIGAVGVTLCFCGGIAVLLAIAFAVSGVLESAGVTPVYSHSLGFLLSGLLGAGIGWAVLRHAKTRFSLENLTPSRTASTLREAWQWAKTKLTPNTDDEQNHIPP